MRRDLVRPRGFTLIELMVVVSIIGLLSATAIPSFMRYVRLSKTVEATMNLRRLSDSATAYHAAEHAGPNGEILSRQWPLDPDHVSSPPLFFNCFLTGGKYDPQFYASEWARPLWQALSFSMDDPFYYSYEAHSIDNVQLGNESGQIYVVAAQGDLNCDYWTTGGLTGLFMRTLRVNDDLSLNGSAGLYIKNATE